MLSNLESLKNDMIFWNIFYIYKMCNQTPYFKLKCNLEKLNKDRDRS